MQISLGRFQILSSNQLIAPGKCAGCGGITKRRFVDFGLELDFYGVVYLCLDVCFVEVANQIGFLSPEQAVAMQAELQGFVEENIDLKQKLETLSHVESAIANYNGVYPSPLPVIGDPGDVPPSSSEERIEPEGPVNPEPEGGEQGSPEQVNESGPEHVHNDDSLEQFAKEFNI